MAVVVYELAPGVESLDTLTFNATALAEVRTFCLGPINFAVLTS